LGFKAIVDHKYWGVLYKNEVFQPLQRGQKLKAFIKKLRPDKRIDLILNLDKYGEKVDATSSKILAVLSQHNGYIAITDKSPPEMIYDSFGISKKIFKQAIGGLYKQRKIVIEDNGIRLVNQ
jgi:predicted RNA-binding protein (virulence factor B family)